MLKQQIRSNVTHRGAEEIVARPAAGPLLNPSILKRVAQILILAVGYFVVAMAVHIFLRLSPGVVIMWPTIGLAVAGLVLFGRRAWLGIAIGGLLARLFSEPLAMEAVGFTVAGVVAPVTAAWLLERYALDGALSRLRDVLAVIILGGAVSALLSATISLLVVMATGDPTRGHLLVYWFSWWQNDAMGVVLVTPPLLVTGTAARLRVNPFQRRGMEMAALAIVAAIATYLLFGSGPPVTFLVFPFVLWTALRLGVPGAAILNVLLAGIAVWAAIEKRGPFSQLPPVQGQIVLQSFCASVAITSLVLAAITTERQQAIDDARASRARIVKAADAERRRVERNLHDGAQQRLVSLSLLLRLGQMHLGAQPDPELKTVLDQASDEIQGALNELRELARGLHPAILTHQGLSAALQSLAEQTPLPVILTVPALRFAAEVESTAYFVVCEALVNVVKYAQASEAFVSVTRTDGRLSVRITDDGIGGADAAEGSGLVGLADRVAALGGRLQVCSPIGGGTRVSAELPCE